VTLDITDEDHVKALDAVLPAHLDAVVNNAGVVVAGPVEAMRCRTFAGSWRSTWWDRLP